MAEEQQREERRRVGIGEGIRTTIGILGAFKEAVEETFQEAVDRGDIGSDRAKRVVQDAAQRVQDVFDGAKERFEFVPRAEFEALRAEVAELRRRMEGGPAHAEEEPRVLESEHDGDADGRGPIITEGE
jgi:polyhydroxyalkanoate synthesis regulator phasin